MSMLAVSVRLLSLLPCVLGGASGMVVWLWLRGRKRHDLTQKSLQQGPEQRSCLFEQRFKDWQGMQVEVDKVLVIGVRF